MKRVDRYILSSFVGPFVAVLLVVIFVLMLQMLWVYIDELVGKGLGFRVILEFLWWGICTILPLALPLATLLTSVMVVGNLAENNELLALKASGVSFARVLAPLFAASMLIAVGTFLCVDRLVPKAYLEMYSLRKNILKTKDEIKIPAGVFYDGIEGYILRVDETDKETGMMRGVMVYDHTDRKGNTSLTIADSAILKMSKTKDYLVFQLFNGYNYQENDKVSYRDTTYELQRIAFDQQEMIIGLSNYAFDKSDTTDFSDQAKAKSTEQLAQDRDTLRIQSDKLLKSHISRYLRNVPLNYRAQLDTANKSMPTQLFDNPDFMHWRSLDEQISALGSARQMSERFKSELSMYAGDRLNNNFYLRRTLIEFFKKFATALACLVLFFIGAPLGALMRKGGLGGGAIVGVLFFVLYWVVDMISTRLAQEGVLACSPGAFMATIVLAQVGAFLTWKAVKESELFNMDSLKIRWRRLKSKVRGWFRPVRIVYMGTPEFAVAPLDRLVGAGYKVVGVVTVADKPSGRGLKMNESAVKQYAVSHGIPVLQPLKLKDPQFLGQLRALKADLFVVVAFRMLPEEVWSMPRLGTINLHAALLPQYRGAAPINWAVINGEKRTGVTTFMIDKNIDTGGIILREDMTIAPDETAGSLHDRMMPVGANLVLQTVQGLVEGNVETRLQRSFIQGSEVLKAAPKLSRELAHIDWNDTTKHIYNLIRGLSPYPAAYTTFVSADGDESRTLQVKIYGASPRAGLNLAPGQIASDGRSYLAIGTSDGAIELTDIQASGKKRMEIKAFLAGFRDPQNWHADLEGTSRVEIERARNL